ncbi:MAG: allantoinase AllB [Chthoniobacterales bacterium]|nr:allantoinase AllB [Chthoniobacterales bacterium]
MSDFDLLVRGGEQDIGVSDGKIVAFGRNLAGSASEEIDALDLAIFPGAIDAHVHFNEPGRTDWEGFATGSRAAAAGGTTTIFDMPLNAHPPTIDGPSFDAKRAAAEKNSWVDFGLWGGLVPGNLEQLETLRARGVVGLKAFMCGSGIDDFPAVNHATLRAGMKRAAELDLLVAVHAESNELIGAPSDHGTVRDYLASRPIEAELSAVQTALDLARETGCRLHIVHVSCGRGVTLVADARAQGVDVTCETCPHYLFLNDQDMTRLGAVAKCAPPLRAQTDQDELWQRLGDVTTIGSDHSPSPWSLKEEQNFFRVWGGISSCQHLLPLLIDAAEKISRAEIARLTSIGVAERFRISEKGGLTIGKDADFTLVDLQAEEVISTDTLHYRNPHTPYLGRKLRGRVVQTMLRGQTIFKNGHFVGTGRGRFLHPGSR